jgi:hypothetical protein
MDKKIKIIDGLDYIKNRSIEDIICSFYFIDKESVDKINEFVISEVNGGKKIPVRFSEKKVAFKKEISCQFKNRKTAKGKTTNGMYYSTFRNSIPIVIDSDGNKTVRDNIKKVTGHIICSSQIKNNTVINYTLCHIWDKTEKPLSRTSDPLYFSLLWNIVLIPLSLSAITDKNEDSLYASTPESPNREFIKLIKKLIKAIAINLYNPNDFLAKFGYEGEIKEDLSVGERSHEDIMKWANDMIKGGIVHFLPHTE